MGTVDREDSRVHPRPVAQVQRDPRSDHRHGAHDVAAAAAGAHQTAGAPGGRDRNQQDGDDGELPARPGRRLDGE